MNLPKSSYWIACAGLVIYALATMDFQTPYAAMCGLGILAVSVAPFYFWASDEVPGIPVYPAYALTYAFTHALPLIQGFSSARVHYKDDQIIAIGMIVIYFLALGGICWYQAGARPNRLAGGYLCVPSQGVNGGLLAMMAICAATFLSLKGQWLPVQGAFASTLTISSVVASTLATALLAYHWGARDLKKEERVWFVLLLTAHLLLQISNTLLFGAAMLTATAFIAFTIGRQRLPVLAAAVSLLVFGFLQLGKPEVRRDLWSDSKISQGVADMPRLWAQWFWYSVKAVVNIEKGASEENKAASLLERTRLIHILILVQKKTSEGTPLLNGRTYWLVPQAMVPRLFNRDKIWTHEGTYIMCVHYGLQTREATRTTTIGFGLLAEAYANFGLPGVTGLAIILGVGMGVVGRRSAGLPFLAYRTLFAFAVLVQFLHTEACASLLIPSIAQTTAIMLAMTQVSA